MIEIVKIGNIPALRLEAPTDPGSFPEGYHEDLLCYWPCGRGSFDLNLPGVGLACLAGHHVVEDENHAITVSPSILTEGAITAERHVQAHGYLERGIWRDV